jgi:predicted ABC-type sugar transport system permease subunit
MRVESENLLLTGPGPRARNWFRSQIANLAPFATLLALVIFFGIASPSFASVDNLTNILTEISVTGIMAVGLTFVILCGEIDLSVASIANATGIAVAFFTAQAASVNIANIPLSGGLAIAVALLGCVTLGVVNAIGVTRIGIPSFIMTLAMLQIASGIGAMLIRGQIAYAVPPLISMLGSKSIGPVPWIVAVAATVLLLGYFTLTYTRFGRYVYMVGGNREAAEYSGVNVRARVAVIVNEFGEVGIDSKLVVQADEQILEMNNGCICCTVRSDLIRIIGDLMQRQDKFDHLLIETTGLADPGPVIQSFFTNEIVHSQTQLDAIVTVVDAKQRLGAFQ